MQAIYRQHSGIAHISFHIPHQRKSRLLFYENIATSGREKELKKKIFVRRQPISDSSSTKSPIPQSHIALFISFVSPFDFASYSNKKKYHQTQLFFFSSMHP